MNYKLTGISLVFYITALACSPSAFEKFNSQPKAEEIDSYIVVLKKSEVKQRLSLMGLRANKKNTVEQLLKGLAHSDEIQLAKVFSVVLEGGVYKMTASQAKVMAQNPNVAYIEKDRIIHVQTLQSNATWGLDRLDQNSLPLDQKYNYPDAGVSVNAYVIDTGILSSHEEFGGRASGGIDLVDQDNDPTDCNGHGTHVAGTIGSNTYGVAKNVKLIGVRVLDCNGSGSYSNVIAGIEWVTANHVKPAVANMSLGGPISQAVDDAVAASVQAGVTYVVAAGNENTNACNSSPSRVAQAITVGSTTSSDQRSSFSNYGSCVDIFAPGSDILSTWYTSTRATNTISGTSMASPHVAGVAAIYLSKNPSATPAQLASALNQGAVVGKLQNVGTNSPNLLLNTIFLNNSGGGGGGGETGPVLLANNQTLGNLSGAKDSEKHYVLEVSAGSANLSFVTSGGSGDADLYVKYGSQPSSSSYDCRPYTSGNAENCNVATPAAGKWFVMLKGYEAYSGMSLSAKYEEKTSELAPCTACSHYSGELKSTGAYEYKPSSSYQSAAGTQQFWLKGPATADFDIYLYKYQNSNWVQVASSLRADSEEKISYNGSSGSYRLKVISYSGTGKYDLWKKGP